MATRKKVIVPDKGEPVETEDVQAQTSIWATPGTMSPNGFVVKREPRIEWVSCAEVFPDLPLLRVGVDVNVAVRVREGVDIPGTTPIDRAMRRFSILFPQWEGWAFADDLTNTPIPQPDPADHETYKPLVWRYSPLADFGTWLNGVAIPKAIIQSMGN